jgi:hypothetical protein
MTELAVKLSGIQQELPARVLANRNCSTPTSRPSRTWAGWRCAAHFSPVSTAAADERAEIKQLRGRVDDDRRLEPPYRLAHHPGLSYRRAAFRPPRPINSLRWPNVSASGGGRQHVSAMRRAENARTRAECGQLPRPTTDGQTTGGCECREPSRRGVCQIALGLGSDLNRPVARPGPRKAHCFDAYLVRQPDDVGRSSTRFHADVRCPDGPGRCWCRAGGVARLAW